MKPMDALGNILQKGDMVVIVNAQGTVLKGTIVDINEGGIVAPSLINPKGSPQGNIMPGEINISLAPTKFLYNPTQPLHINGIYKVVKPPELDSGGNA